MDSFSKKYAFPLLFVLLLASCTSAPKFRGTPGGFVSATSDPQRQEIVQYARSCVGTPYRTGGTTRSGVDCSGLVLSVYSRFDVSLPRTSRAQSRSGEPVDRSDVEPGDLVFFRTGRQSVSHVGIYIGGGRFIHASTSARQVRIDDLDDDYFRNRYVTARRVIGG
jgi:cell wall-associated NlpC family hydrolase